MLVHMIMTQIQKWYEQGIVVPSFLLTVLHGRSFIKQSVLVSWSTMQICRRACLSFNDRYEANGTQVARTMVIWSHKKQQEILGKLKPDIWQSLLSVHLFSADFIPVHADESTLPPGQSLGDQVNNTTDFRVPSDVCKVRTNSIAKALLRILIGLLLSKKRWNSSSTQQRDARGIVVRINERLVAQDTRQLRRELNMMRWMLRVTFSMEKLRKKCMSPQPKALKILTSQSMVTVLVLKLCFGLHQAPRDWYADCCFLFTNTIIEEVLLTRHCSSRKDSRDILLVQEEFEMSAMGEMDFFLGLQVKQLPDGIFISQDKSMIGSLMYLTASRPDIMFAVSACSRHQVTPLTSHLNAVKKIFKYLKGQPKLGLWYPKDTPFQLEAYSDSDYAGSHGDRKSTTGGCQFLGRRLISWQCKKQTILLCYSSNRAGKSYCCSIDAVDRYSGFRGPVAGLWIQLLE
ncbi:hypothetical protein Tco_0857106 [Tanacetum coccineum]|uniref:Uncharacterized protein n=1 Tax=Tanacetum coccineum TaxID=301880 RepID=A0ABQ5B9K2_9ASTR